MDPNIVDFSEFLKWVAAAGAPYITGQIFAYIAENVPKWHQLPREVKFLAPMFVSILLAGGATLLLQNTEVVEMVGEGWAVIAGAILMYFGSQQAYLKITKSSYGDSAVREAK